MQRVFSIVESPMHPDLSALYASRDIENHVFTSQRKAIAALKKVRPDYVVADFIYGYGNNYAGANVSNLDVFLCSLQKYAPDAGVVVLVEKAEREHVAKLERILQLKAVLTYPVSGAQIGAALA